MVQISICWGGQFECAETNVVQGFIVNAVKFRRCFLQAGERTRWRCMVLLLYLKPKIRKPHVNFRNIPTKNIFGSYLASL